MTDRRDAPEERVTAVVLAAGQGARLGTRSNKVFLEVGGRTLLAHALLAFASEEAIQDLVLVLRAGDEKAVQAVLQAISKPVRLVHGGKRRQDSSLAGVTAAHDGIVLVHDAARPFPSPRLIHRVIEGVRQHGACVPAVRVSGTLRYAGENGRLLPGGVDHRDLLEMQTPQGFRRDVLLDALRAASGDVTDDAEAVLALGKEVFAVSGEATNLKVTTPEDLVLARGIASLRSGWDGRVEASEGTSR